MFLIDAKQEEDTENEHSRWVFLVEGYSGRIYSVNFNSNKMSCTCPDYNIR
jgi:hypothetical protein